MTDITIICNPQLVAKHKPLHLCFTPAHGSWLNQIEIWFGMLTRKMIRRGSIKSGEELVRTLLQFIEDYNRNAQPSQWTYRGKSGLKMSQCN